MTRVLRAAWVLPIAAGPVRNGWVAVDGGRIAGVGADGPDDASHPGGRRDADVDLGRVAVLPGLVNAHTHLELSYLHRAIPPSECFTDWVRDVMRRQRGQRSQDADVVVGAAVQAIHSARAAGTSLIGDISNTLVTVPLLAEAAMPAVVFHELIGFDVADPDAVVARARTRMAALPPSVDIAMCLAAHAPYSVSPGLFAAIRADMDAQPVRVASVHLGESPEEVELLRTGLGPWRTILEDLGTWSSGWRVPGASPVEYLEGLGFLDRGVLAVHGVQLTGPDLGRLHALDVTLVSCPRSNRHVGVGPPPIEMFYAFDVPVAFGTDSLASVDDLNLFSELAEAHRLAPRVPARLLLEGATRTGARALGFGDELGTIEVGKRAALIAVQIPGGVTDVEEYLVSGIDPRDIAWLDDEVLT